MAPESREALLEDPSWIELLHFHISIELRTCQSTAVRQYGSNLVDLRPLCPYYCFCVWILPLPTAPMAYKTFRAPLGFVQSGILFSLFVIVLSAHLSLVTAGKTGTTSTSVSFVTSSEDWSKGLDNIKPYGPSAKGCRVRIRLNYFRAIST